MENILNILLWEILTPKSSKDSRKRERAYCIGQYVFNPENKQIDELPESQFENRELLVSFCMDEDYVIPSTFFQKSHQNLITFRNTQSATFEPPFTSTKFSQIDFILTKHKWRNSIKDINATHLTALESDHKMLVANVSIKLAKKKIAPTSLS